MIREIIRFCHSLKAPEVATNPNITGGQAHVCQEPYKYKLFGKKYAPIITVDITTAATPPPIYTTGEGLSELMR